MTELEFNTLEVIDEAEVTEFIENELVGTEFLVCDEEGREKAARENILESLWAFNTDFIINHLKAEIKEDMVTSWQENQLAESLKVLQEKMCEGANSIVKALVNLDEFIEDAISCDGYGHFLSHYDGEEVEFTTEDGTDLYLYRQN